VSLLLLRCGATPRRSNSPDASVRASRPKATVTASAPNLSAANDSSKSRQREWKREFQSTTSK